MSFSSRSITLFVLFLVLSLLSCSVYSQSSSSSSSSSSTGSSIVVSRSSSSSSRPLQPYPWPVYSVPGFSAISLTFDVTGRLYAVCLRCGTAAALFNVSSTSNVTLVGYYPSADSDTAFSQIGVYRNLSGPTPVTSLIGSYVYLYYDGEAKSYSPLAVTQDGDNMTRWAGWDYALLSYPGIILADDNPHGQVVAVDQTLALLYLVVQSCNAVLQYTISIVNGNQTILTQSIALTGSNPFLYQPVGVAVDAASLVYVCDSSNRVVQFNSQGVQLAVLIDLRTTSFVSFPSFTIDPSTGQFLVIDTKANLIRRYSRDGSSQSSLSLPYGDIISGLAVSAHGDVFVFDATIQSILVVPASQAAPLSGGGGSGGGGGGGSSGSSPVYGCSLVVLAVCSVVVMLSLAA